MDVRCMGLGINFEWKCEWQECGEERKIEQKEKRKTNKEAKAKASAAQNRIEELN